MDLKKLLKNRNNRLMLGIFIIGVVIILLSALFDNTKTPSQSTDNFAGEEQRLSEILSEINGAGRVSVMISYEKTEDSQTGIGRGLTDTKGYEKPRGVIVVADGAVTPSVRNSLKEAAVAITGVGANRVCVYPR